jgi:hypothetical protein
MPISGVSAAASAEADKPEIAARILAARRRGC